MSALTPIAKWRSLKAAMQVAAARACDTSPKSPRLSCSRSLHRFRARSVPCLFAASPQLSGTRTSSLHRHRQAPLEDRRGHRQHQRRARLRGGHRRHARQSQ
eukprot:604847-Pyramimonas_sp.AAC.1